jgi:hypothetical protein
MFDQFITIEYGKTGSAGLPTRRDGSGIGNRRDVRMNRPGNNRRNAPRKPPAEPVEVAFYKSGGLYFGSVANLSPGGACLTLSLEKSGKEPALSAGSCLDCCITSYDGTSKCRGEVRWIRLSDGRWQCGIAFRGTSSDEDDPLTMTIHRYFCSAYIGRRRYLRPGRVYR